MQELHLTQEWDKVFPKSDQVDHKKVTFTNHFGSGPIHTKELRRSVASISGGRTFWGSQGTV